MQDINRIPRVLRHGTQRLQIAQDPIHHSAKNLMVSHGIFCCLLRQVLTLRCIPSTEFIKGHLNHKRTCRGGYQSCHCGIIIKVMVSNALQVRRIAQASLYAIMSAVRNVVVLVAFEMGTGGVVVPQDMNRMSL